MYKKILSDFYYSNKFIVTTFILVTILILPIEAIGFSKYITKIITSVNKKNYSNISYLMLIIIFIYCFTKFLVYIQYYLQIIIDNKLVKQIREQMFISHLHKSKNKYNEVELGKLISHFVSIPHTYQDLVYRFLKKILPNIGALFILTIYFYYVHFKIGIILSLLILTMILIYSIFGKKCITMNVKKMKHYHNINESIQDKFANIFSIIVNNESSNEIKKNSLQENNHHKLSIHADLGYFKLNLILNIIIAIYIIIVYYIFYTLFIQKSLQNKELLVSSFLVFFYFVKYLDNTKWFLIDFFNLIAIIKSYDYSINVKDNVNLKGNLVDFLSNGQIEFQNVCFSYGKNIIHDHVNFIISPKKINVLIGRSGSGKSTILKMILNLINPTYGHILIDKTNLKLINIHYLRDNIGIVDQNIKLFNDSIYNNIKYGNKKITKSKVKNIIHQLRLNETIFKNKNNILDIQTGVNGSNLSNGQRQTILILRTLLQNKKIIIFDEPTSSIDVALKNTILKIIKRLSSNKTIIIATHDKDVLKISDHTIAL